MPGAACSTSWAATSRRRAPVEQARHTMNRDDAIRETARLIAEGERLRAAPSLGAMRLWLQLSDDLLSSAWGSMDRYHLSWLMVGRPPAPRGRAMTPEEEVAYVRDVAEQKTAVLRMSLRALEEQGIPFVGETPRRGGMAGHA